MAPSSAAAIAPLQTPPVLGAVLDDLNAPDQAIAYLKVSRDTLNRFCRLGHLGFVKAGKERRYTRARLVDFVRRQSHMAYTAPGTAPTAGNVTKIGRPRTTRSF